MEANVEDAFEEFLESLPRQKVAGIAKPVAQYKGFWFTEYYLKGLGTFQKHFQAKDCDIILASPPKSGTTWLKALTFAILNRTKFSISESPLLSFNPHQLVRFLDIDIYDCGRLDDHDAVVSMASPRLLATHAPYQLLPTTVLEAGSRMIYVCRNPLDTFTSALHFYSQIGVLAPNQTEICVDALFGSFCDGVFPFGPFWDHILGYWEASLRDDGNKVLFLKYEDMLKDTNSSVVKIAEFLGCGFSEEERSAGLVERITKLCEWKNLRSLECNKSGGLERPSILKDAKNSLFFRKGKVGDWVNSLNPSLAQRMETIIQEKLGKSGLTFDIN